jgi:hypothetical protein
MNRGRVGEERGSKEMDGCPLTGNRTFHSDIVNKWNGEQGNVFLKDVVNVSLHDLD